MINLSKSLPVWGSEHFSQTFINEVSQLSLEKLPLQQAMSVGNVASKHNLQILIHHKREELEHLLVHCGIFYSSLISGCNCADDPTPIDYNTEYCELEFKIDKSSGETLINIRDES
jgi:hypothetical protein